MENNFKIVELILGDEEEAGIDAISLVEHPAIEEDFIALKNERVEFKTIDEDKRIIIGLALIPNKPIYRRNDNGEEYYIYFSRKTVRQAAEGFLKKHKVHNATLEHQVKTDGVSVVESWIVEDVEKDKTAMYGLNASVGSWAVVQRVDNDEVWADVKAGKYRGLSIEGYFADKMERPKDSVGMSKEDKEAYDLIDQIKNILNE